MTLLGKVFTVLIFVMSILFMGFAVAVFATHKNWKMLVTNETKTPDGKYDIGLVQKYKQLTTVNQSLKDEADGLTRQLNQERAARRSAIGVLETKLKEAQDRLTAKEGELRTLQTTEGESAAALKTAQLTVEGLRAEVGQLRADIKTAQTDRDRQFEKVVELTDSWHATKGLARNLSERQRQLIEEIRVMKQTLQNAPVGLIPAAGEAPDLNGLVMRVEKQFIVVSLGSDDGLRVGHRLHISRPNVYLGYAVVVKTEPDKLVAQIDEKSQKGKIEVNDIVTTRLGRSSAG